MTTGDMDLTRLIVLLRGTLITLRGHDVLTAQFHGQCPPLGPFLNRTWYFVINDGQRPFSDSYNLASHSSYLNFRSQSPNGQVSSYSSGV